MEAVDLGLSVKWATSNVGAMSPEEYGNYYAWGETEIKTDYSWKTYKWCNGGGKSLTKYNYKTTYGLVDNKYELKRAEHDGETMDDTARGVFGGKWRMAKYDEWSELMDTDNCSWLWTTVSGVNGYLVTSKIEGYTNNSIFLPVAGNRDGSELVHNNSAGTYWSSSLSTERPYDGNAVSFYQGYFDWGIFYRYYGFSVRPVCPKD